MNLRHLAAVGAMAVAVGCGTNTGNALVDLQVAVTSSQNLSATMPTGADAQNSTLTVTSARAHIRHIEADLPEGVRCEDLDQLTGLAKCKSDDAQRDDEDKVSVEGPFIADLIAGTAEPELAGVTIPPGTYTRIDVRLDDSKTSEGLVDPMDPLADMTLVAAGTYDDGSGTLPFTLELKINEDARFQNAAGITLSEGAAESILLQLDVAAWFATLPITKCIADGDIDVSGGTLVIEDTSGDCSGLEGALKEAIKNSGQFDKK